MKPLRQQFASALLAVAIGVAGAFCLMSWAACESHEPFCAFRGEVSK